MFSKDFVLKLNCDDMKYLRSLCKIDEYFVIEAQVNYIETKSILLKYFDNDSLINLFYELTCINS